MLFPQVEAIHKCDNTLVTAWYRFNSTAGTKMPTTCVSKNRCNTHASGWLNGTHPTPQEGIVNRRVCFHWSSNCCNWDITIKVRKCGLFYVYRLVSPPYCSIRYCVTNWERQEPIIHSLNSPLQKQQGDWSSNSVNGTLIRLLTSKECEIIVLFSLKVQTCVPATHVCMGQRAQTFWMVTLAHAQHI